MKRTTISWICFLLLTITAAFGQSGGSYEISQSVVANGGGTSEGGPYSITGTTAQSIAGIQSSNGPYSARGGFWQFFLAPTAANVSVSGRVTDFTGRPIFGVRVTLEGAGRLSLTNPFGYFSFEDVPVGRAYILAPAHGRYSFTTRTIVVNDSISDIELVALP